MLLLLLLLPLLHLAACDDQVDTMCPGAEPMRVPFVLYGLGGVGSELLRVILASRSAHAMRYGLRFSAVGVCDSSGAVLPQSSGGDSELTDATLDAVLKHKAGGHKLAHFDGGGGKPVAPQGEGVAEFLKRLARESAEANPGLILVDCTATDATTPALLLASELQSVKAVSANKKPFASSIDAFARLLAPGVSRRVRYESTVCAGVPVIASLHRVIASSDSVRRIAGSFSGTLGYVMSALQRGERFSEVVARAKSLGYTEPDPRDDLGGVDVARKALILARTLGLKLEMADVSVEPLFPASMVGMPVPEFMQQLPSLDAGFSARVEAAMANGKVLRYAASIELDSTGASGTLVVGLQEVAADSPLGALQGTDNLVEMSTAVYSDAPLVLRGAGAGVSGTAAGVLADMVDIAFT